MPTARSSHSTSAESRKTGISAVGDLPWGSHCCLFYDAKTDLLDILVPFFKAGLEEGELCVWVVSDPLTVEEATAAFRRAVPDLDRYLTQGSLEILTHREWYLKEGSFDLSRVIARCREKLEQAISTGRTGLRFTGDGSWVQAESRHDFHQYEKELNRLITNQRLLILCTYQLALSGAPEILDAARTHHFALALRKGKWQLLESPQLKAAKTEIIKLNEQLERRVVERTRELRALSSRLESLRDEEHRRISREIHDELGQKLTALKMNLLHIERKLGEMETAPTVNKLVDGVVTSSVASG